MRVTKKPIFNSNNDEIGAILIGYPTDKNEKEVLDNKTFRYVFDELYPDENLSYFKNDAFSAVIRDVNNILPEQELDV